jgi:hypothetical protein
MIVLLPSDHSLMFEQPHLIALFHEERGSHTLAAWCLVLALHRTRYVSMVLLCQATDILMFEQSNSLLPRETQFLNFCGLSLDQILAFNPGSA